MDLLFIVIASALALVFAFSGLSKLADPGFRYGLGAFGVPKSLIKPVTIALPLAELAIAAAIVIPATRWWGALVALLALVAFIVAIAYQLSRGRKPDCHCFGRFGGGPVGIQTIARNALLAGLAIATLIGRWPDVRPLFSGWLGGASSVETTLLLLDLSLFAALALLGALMVMGYQRVMRAIPLAGQGVVLEEPARKMPENPITLSQAPEIGEPAPVLELANLRGERIDLASFLGTELVLVFSRPTCAACRALLPDLQAFIASAPPDTPLPVVVSRGSVDANQHYAVLPTPVLLAQDDEAAYAFGVSGIPSAVRIDASGNVASQVVFGNPRVRKLIGMKSDSLAESARSAAMARASRVVLAWRRRSVPTS